MKKFWTVLLRITMIVSLIGILVFAGVAIIKNRNIAYEAYNYISTGIEKENFDDMFDKFKKASDSGDEANEGCVVYRYGGTDDKYMSFVNSAVMKGLAGCKTYLDYMAVLPNVTKGEQDNAEKCFDQFISAYKKTLASYDIYVAAYKNAKVSKGERNAVAIMESKEGNLVSTYIICYNELTSLLLSLHDIVSKYAFEGEMTFEAQSPIITAGLAQKAISNIFLGTSRNEWLDIYATTNQDIKNYEAYVENSQSSSSNLEITNTDFRNFVNNINSLDTYSWAKNYEDYNASLIGEKKSKSEKAYSYLVNQIIRTA